MNILITDYGFANVDTERKIFATVGHSLATAQCRTVDDVIAAARDADALLVQWAPINAKVIEALTRCKIIVRYGIGVDNVDTLAAQARGIPVCNVPDYCINEVADHTLSLALALARQLPQIDARTRAGAWKITADRPMPAFNEMLFATTGFGRIARAVHLRAQAFGFQLAAFDPYIPAEVFAAAGVKSMPFEDLCCAADILSLHSPLNSQTSLMINARVLQAMKPSAIIINTARGGLIDTLSLASALSAGQIGGAGIDVFEAEPLPADHPLRQAPNALLTSHVAWYSQASVPELQRLAALEILRGLSGRPVLNQVNK